MNKRFSTLVILTIVVVFIPQVVFASWWNPLTWNVFSRLKKPAPQVQVIKVIPPAPALTPVADPDISTKKIIEQTVPKSVKKSSFRKIIPTPTPVLSDRDQLIEKIDAMEKQGISQKEIQDYLDSFKGKTTNNPITPSSNLSWLDSIPDRDPSIDASVSNKNGATEDYVSAYYKKLSEILVQQEQEQKEYQLSLERDRKLAMEMEKTANQDCITREQTRLDGVIANWQQMKETQLAELRKIYFYGQNPASLPSSGYGYTEANVQFYQEMAAGYDKEISYAQVEKQNAEGSCLLIKNNIQIPGTTTKTSSIPNSSSILGSSRKIFTERNPVSGRITGFSDGMGWRSQVEYSIGDPNKVMSIVGNDGSRAEFNSMMGTITLTNR